MVAPRMVRSVMGLVCAATVLLVVGPAMAQVEGGPQPEGKLTVVWASGDPEVADDVCLMYTHFAKKFGMFAEVRLIVWGPSQRVLAENADVQAKVKAMQADGVVVQACIACAKKLGLVDRLRELGVEVAGMGVPLTEALKDPDTHVLVF